MWHRQWPQNHRSESALKVLWKKEKCRERGVSEEAETPRHWPPAAGLLTNFRSRQHSLKRISLSNWLLLIRQPINLYTKSSQSEFEKLWGWSSTNERQSDSRHLINDILLPNSSTPTTVNKSQAEFHHKIHQSIAIRITNDHLVNKLVTKTRT